MLRRKALSADVDSAFFCLVFELRHQKIQWFYRPCSYSTDPGNFVIVQVPKTFNDSGDFRHA
ncbi:Aminopeptidase N [Pseudomonas syringae pv. actinidiae]|uniref:Aminopeptidase N n=1 Tax=Pseudomonas syringae pv. actinidiae TaxID=103796 RepID=A0A2V0QEE1_PSESF|nr:Aminopeptidase N [Pseudomonas syringae pv. actinidiae]